MKAYLFLMFLFLNIFRCEEIDRKLKNTPNNPANFIIMGKSTYNSLPDHLVIRKQGSPEYLSWFVKITKDSEAKYLRINVDMGNKALNAMYKEKALDKEETMQLTKMNLQFSPLCRQNNKIYTADKINFINWKGYNLKWPISNAEVDIIENFQLDMKAVQHDTFHRYAYFEAKYKQSQNILVINIFKAILLKLKVPENHNTENYHLIGVIKNEELTCFLIKPEIYLSADFWPTKSKSIDDDDYITFECNFEKTNQFISANDMNTLVMLDDIPSNGKIYFPIYEYFKDSDETITEPKARAQSETKIQNFCSSVLNERKKPKVSVI